MYVINRQEHSRCCASRNDSLTFPKPDPTHIVTVVRASNVNEKNETSRCNGYRRYKIFRTVGTDPKGFGGETAAVGRRDYI